MKLRLIGGDQHGKEVEFVGPALRFLKPMKISVTGIYADEVPPFAPSFDEELYYAATLTTGERVYCESNLYNKILEYVRLAEKLEREATAYYLDADKYRSEVAAEMGHASDYRASVHRSQVSRLIRTGGRPEVSH